MINDHSFAPDWASPPGETVADLLRERNLTVRDFASQLGESQQDVELLLNGQARLTKRTAERLSEVLGATTKFWMMREAQFREDLVASQGRRAENDKWIKELPIADMIRMSWLPQVKTGTQKLAACFDFFDVASVEEWRARSFAREAAAAFRTSQTFSSEQGALSAWLRRGEIEADSVDCMAWNRTEFAALLPRLRALTRLPDPERFIPKLVEQCAGCGVAVVIVRAPKGCRASGITRFLTSQKALIQLSFRHLSDDHFWFTFFHEAGHVLLHGERTFVEGVDSTASKEEEDANRFAADTLVPPEHKEAMLQLPHEARAVIRFAKQIGVSPGIVVGQLQFLRKLRPSQLNSLKRRFEWG